MQIEVLIVVDHWSTIAKSNLTNIFKVPSHITFTKALLVRARYMAKSDVKRLRKIFFL